MFTQLDLPFLGALLCVLLGIKMLNHCPFKKPIVFEKRFERYNATLESILNVGLLRDANEIASRTASNTLETLSFATLDGKPDEAERLLKIALGLGLAHFLLAMNPGKDIVFEVDKRKFEAVGKVVTYSVHFDFWLQIFSAAVITKSWDAVKVLCQLDINTVKQSELGCDALDEALFNMIVGLFDKGADLKRLIIEVMEKSDMSYIAPERRDYAYEILMPFANVLTTIVSKDGEQKFLKAMSAGIESHQKYWSKEDLKSSPSGWLSLPLCAAAVLGKTQKGYSDQFDKVYVPDSFL
jgi:hypothetical protein